ncbi:MAG: oligosaccharide flippase family protein, partial [Anaerolineae bacterium]|nr:oligosaccharide flippase family protein [Anaerolineae bacterium]
MILTKLYRKYQSTLTVRAGSWYIVATFAQKGIVFLAIPIFARLLTPAQYGTVALFSSWLEILTIILTLNLHSALNNARYDFEGAQFKDLVSAVLTLGILCIAVGNIVLALLPETLTQAVFGLPKSLVMLASLGTLAMFPYQVRMTTWRIALKYTFYNLVNFLTTSYGILLSVGLILVFTLVLPAYDHALARIVGLIAPYIAVSLLIVRHTLKDSRTFFRQDYWRYALALALPLMLHSLSNILMKQFDRVLINQYFGRSETGIYTLAYQFGDIANMLWVATNSAWFPWFFTHMSKGNHTQIRKRASQYALAFGVIVTGLIFIAPLLIRLLAPEEYWQATAIVPIVMATGFFSLLYSLYGNVELYEKKAGYTAMMTVLAAAVNIILNIILLPIYGYQIAAWTTLVSYICLFLGHAAIV